MRFALSLLLAQSVPLENVYYGPAQPCCNPMYQSWPRVPSGCTANRETGLITCGTALLSGAATSVSVTIQ
jgi:hypothetical protein